jgi:hypothetical protein
MPRTCTVCRHDHLQEIDGALLAAQPLRHIAAQFGLSTGALQRHKNEAILPACPSAGAGLILVAGLQERIVEALKSEADDHDIRARVLTVKLAKQNSLLAHRIEIDAMVLLGGALKDWEAHNGRS